ncbi:hypothetical protein A2803_00355 [Candidatus Woesebacteria bacterium RIFCSPHIGHO2_01_FULL_44_21]|uniref:Uncharacterized protein n=1 Tax=Candidatus Woesebacteria bacterium RIFCSPHIGHO2_01_FULL_44_21 TaxID=1802503 RepID=A0A1F7YXE5_9BACT|nr:MAG: hypothetical protein A2803_00355 [Candidatus Woesebacteria bacterium RIFCSPHIGHO2_01_FULL_44_21]OGM68921.1 MAG: hypothetical protein A2897_02050 [Candidatus Woesebacteria bacterium RIFCSPLOWO2_01_FULL_44_24b]
MTIERTNLGSPEVNSVRHFPDVFINDEQREIIERLRSEITRVQANTQAGRFVQLVSEESNINQLVLYDEIELALGLKGMTKENVISNLYVVIHNVRNDFFDKEASLWSKFDLAVKRGRGVILLPENQYDYMQLPALRINQPSVLKHKPEWLEPYLAVNQRFVKSASGNLNHIVNPYDIKCLDKLIKASNVELEKYKVIDLVMHARQAGVKMVINHPHSVPRHKLIDMLMIE